MIDAKEENWDIRIDPKTKVFHLNLSEIWRYRDLLILFVKRDLVATYKQTLLGPLWFFIQPIFTTLVYYFMFGNIVSAFTTKYRDFRNLLGYALQFGLYATPIIFPLAWLKEKLPLFYKICLINPMTGIVETFKYAFFGTGVFSWGMLAYSFSFS